MAVLLLSSAGAAWKFLLAPGRNRPDLVLHKVQRGNLVQTIVEKGELQSTDNHDVFNAVNHEALCNSKTSIKSVIEDGTSVKEGDELMRLDASRLEDLLRTQGITRDKAYNDFVFARANLDIVTKQGATELATAQRAVELARAAVDKFAKGDYPQQLADANSKIDLSRAELEQYRDNAGHVERLVKKKFMSAGQGRAAVLKLRSAEEALNKLEGERNVLVNFTYPQTMKELQGKLDDAIAVRDRILIQAAAQKEQAENDLKTKKLVYEDAKEKYAEIKNEIGKCIVRAPTSGLVVYYQSQQSRRGSGSTQSIIAEGEQVFLGQKLMQIPDLKNMLVNVRVHEALVSKVRKGQRARIRPHAFPNRILHGKVKAVANVALQQDWFSGDVKVYEALVEIENESEVPGLKPGMGAEVTLYTDLQADNVLTVPVQAVVRLPGKEVRHRVYRKTASGELEAREVKVGISNEQMVVIEDGLEEGDEVVLNVDVLQADRKAAGEAENKDGAAGKDRKGAAPKDKR